MTLKDLLVKIKFKADKEELDGVEEKLKSIKHWIQGLVAVEIIKGVGELAERFGKIAEELEVAAQSAGISVENFQKLAFSSKQATVSQEELGTSMARVSRRLYEARKGGEEANKVFADAGFTPDQINSFKTGEDVLLALSDKFKNINDPIKKSAIAMELLGRGSINMVGWLSKGSSAIKGQGEEAKKLGIILSGQQVESFVKVEHAMMKIWDVIKSVSAAIASAFTPEIEYLTDALLKWWAANQALIKSELLKWISDLLYALGFVIGVVEGLVKVVMKFMQTHPVLTRLIELVLGIGIALITTGAIFKKSFSLVSEGLNGILTIFKLIRTAAIFNPFTLWVAGIAAVVFLAHDLYTLIFGGKSWSGALSTKLANFLSPEDNSVPADTASSRLNALSKIKNNPLGIGAGAGAIAGGGGGVNVNIDLGMNNVPQGTDPKDVGQHIAKVINSGFEEKLRAAIASTKGPVVY